MLDLSAEDSAIVFCALPSQNHRECYFFARQEKVHQVHTAGMGLYNGVVGYV